MGDTINMTKCLAVLGLFASGYAIGRYNSQPQGKKCLENAIKAGDVKKVKELLYNETFIKSLNGFDVGQVITCAIVSDNSVMLKTLLDCKSLTNLIYFADAYRIIIIAVRHGNAAMFRMLDDENIAEDDFIKRRFGKGIMQYVIKHGTVEMLKMYLGNKADTSLFGGFTESSLMQNVIEYDKPEMLKMLLEDKTVAGLLYSSNVRQMMWGMIENDKPEMLKVLLENKTVIGLLDRFQVTGLMQSAIKHDKPEMLKMLLEDKTVTGLLYSSDVRQMMWGMIENDKPEMLKVLLENKTVIGLLDRFQVTGLMQSAIKHDKPEMLKMLLEDKTVIGLLDRFQVTGLMQGAIKHDKSEMLKILLGDKILVGALVEKNVNDVMWYSIESYKPEMSKILVASEVYQDKGTVQQKDIDCFLSDVERKANNLDRYSSSCSFNVLSYTNSIFGIGGNQESIGKIPDEFSNIFSQTKDIH